MTISEATPYLESVALIYGLKTLIATKQDWPGMGLDGRRFMEAHFDIKRITEKLIALYHE